MSERFKNVRIEELEKMVNERQQFLGKVAAFVVDITQLIGKTTEMNEASCYTTITKEVIGFGHFSFRYHCTWGPDAYTVWYHPDEERIRLNAVTPVLMFEGPGDEKKYIVSIFCKDNVWQAALLKVIEQKDELLAERKKAEEERQEKLRLQTEDERKRSELLLVAERLKL